MEAGLIIGNQIIIMFIILIIGAFCYLKGIITKDGTKQLSSFALNIINPVLIFMSYQSKYDKTLVHGLLWSFLLLLATQNPKNAKMRNNSELA